MKIHRSLIAVFLVVVFAFNMLGYCLFSVLIVTHKKYVFNKIMSGEMDNEEVCVLHEADIIGAEWEHEKEFSWKGEMYDVIKKEYSKDGTIYTCKKDVKEDQLINQKRKSEERSAGTKMIKMTKIFVQSAVCYEIHFTLISVKQSVSTVFKNYSFLYSTIIVPPPKG